MACMMTGHRMPARKTSKTVRRALARALALSLPAWAASGCNIGTGAVCGGVSGVYAPHAVDAGVPACRDDGTAPQRVPACDAFCGSPSPAPGSADAPCCMSLEDPGVVSCPVDCTGRRPTGLSAARAVPDDPRSLGALFARMAFLERASIDAFRILEDDLRRHRAPRALVQAARRAKRDEHRHFRTTRALARRHDADVPPPQRATAGARSLEAIAVENAREGCVREGFGALVALWQAHAAGDAHVRAAMTRIAREETSHAALAWSVHGWAMGRLDPQARRRVRRALREEAALIAHGRPDEPDPALARSAGLPTRAQTRRLASAWIDQFLRRPRRA